MTIREAELVLAVLSVLDLVLVANLAVMVAVSSYETFVQRIVADETARPEWLGTMDAGNVKLKVSLAIVMISAINLLRGFLMDAPAERLPLMAGGAYRVPGVHPDDRPRGPGAGEVTSGSAATTAARLRGGACATGGGWEAG